ncbi:hypothetical protein [Actinocorallia sp. A-T 12471]|uniref:hypothetical protein n=1 Tax=Actinocorallia sp. A-T 12471 TaxID=3089813 RepID=UPI0029D1384E|nr:hypothetical protein [Actinocorallia sp. A-T 12471]MDX6742380.1 hypothetical protein [Actinocorallia sp. A-T 12471]
MKPDWSLRLLRASGFGSVCAVVSAGAHYYGGGALIGPGVFGLAALALTVGAFLLGGRERGMGVILPATFAAQYGLHSLFGELSPVAGVEALDGSGMVSMDHTHGSMLLTHVIVALLSAAWLRRGEELFCALVRRLAARILRLTRPALPAILFVKAPVPAPVMACVPVAVTTEVSRRGPPTTFSL